MSVHVYIMYIFSAPISHCCSVSTEPVSLCEHLTSSQHAIQKWVPRNCYFCLMDHQCRSLHYGCQKPWLLPWWCHTAIFFWSSLGRLPMLASLPSWEKTTEEGGEGKKETQEEGSAAGSTRMLIILSRQFVLHYAGDNAQDNKGRRQCVS